MNDELLEDTIEELTKQMIEETFDLKDKSKEKVITMKKTDLYKFCIKLIKLIKRVSEMEVIVYDDKS